MDFYIIKCDNFYEKSYRTEIILWNTGLDDQMRHSIAFDNKHNSETENCAMCTQHDEWRRGVCTFVGKGNGDNGRNRQFPMRMSAVEAAGFSTLKRLKSTAVRPDSAEPVLGRRLPLWASLEWWVPPIGGSQGRFWGCWERNAVRSSRFVIAWK